MKTIVNYNVKLVGGEPEYPCVKPEYPCVKIWKADLKKELKSPLIVLFSSKDIGVALSDSAPVNRVGDSCCSWENANSKSWVDFEGTIYFSK